MILKKALVIQKSERTEKETRQRFNLEVKNLESEVRDLKQKVLRIKSGQTIFELQEEERRQAEDECLKVRYILTHERN